MQSDDVIWSVIDEQFCSFKTKFEQLKLCKNEYNITGECNRIYCPLANSRYATVLEKDGVLYLYMKTIERAHTPANLWEKIPLAADLKEAVQQINDNLAFWPEKIVNKIKERLVRLNQYLIRYRKWYYRAKPRLVTVNKKFENREKVREMKALVAARLDFAIKNELMNRLKQGTYGEMYNLNNKAFQQIIKEEKQKAKKETRKKPKKWDPITEGDIEDVKAVMRGERGTEEDAGDFDASTTFEEDEDDSDEEVELVDVENDARYQEEEEVDEDENDAIREEMLKKFPINLKPESGDNSEIKHLKQRLINKQKRKLVEKQEKEKKQREKLTKAKRNYGAHVEIEYEKEPATRQVRQRVR